MSIQTKVTVDDELVQLCHTYGERPYHGIALGRISSLSPFQMLKQPLLAHAREFARQLSTQGYEPAADVTEFKVWGPYMEKVGKIKTWVPEEDNHVIPKHLRREAASVWGYGSNELRWDKGCSFIIVGKFQRPASYGHVDEESGVIRV
mgnify:FL=1